MDGTVKVGDLGLAKDLTCGATQDVGQIHQEPTAGKEKTKTVRHTAGLGTQVYSSPEQKKGKFYNQKTDIYSLGIVFLQLICQSKSDHEFSKILEQFKKGYSYSSSKDFTEYEVL